VAGDGDGDSVRVALDCSSEVIKDPLGFRLQDSIGAEQTVVEQHHGNVAFLPDCGARDADHRMHHARIDSASSGCAGQGQ
jgi:hypothetical protein